MGVTAFPLVSGAQLTANDSSKKTEPGTVFAVRYDTDEWAIVEYVQLDNNGCSEGEVLVQNFATVKGYSVKKAATTDEGAPIRGIAAATISSQQFGFMFIGGHVGTADFSHTAASGEYLIVSGSTAGKVTSNRASAFNLGSVTTDASALQVIGVAKAAISTGLGSMQILGIWG